ncbi:hypothetical protein TNCV_3468111 [Trichonephila clavipes]|nr:hypothetical protein TNCV_3468111 [Trichonephila clavipes]
MSLELETFWESKLSEKCFLCVSGFPVMDFHSHMVSDFAWNLPFEKNMQSLVWMCKPMSHEKKLKNGRICAFRFRS